MEEMYKETHHIISQIWQQKLKLVWVDADIGLDSVPGPDGTNLKQLKKYTSNSGWEEDYSY